MIYSIRKKPWINWTAAVYTVFMAALTLVIFGFRPEGKYLAMKSTWWAWTIFILFVLIHGVLIVLSTFPIVKALTLIMLIPQIIIAQEPLLILISMGIYIVAFSLSKGMAMKIGVISLYALILLGTFLFLGGDFRNYESTELKQQFFSPNQQFVAEIHTHFGGNKNGMFSVYVRKTSKQDFGIYELKAIRSYLVLPTKETIEEVVWKDAYTVVVDGEYYFINEQGEPIAQ